MQSTQGQQCVCLLVGGGVALCLAGPLHRQACGLLFAVNTFMPPHQPMVSACTSSAGARSSSDPFVLPRQACLCRKQNMHELVPLRRDDSTSISACSFSILGPFVGCRVGEAKNPGPALPRGQQDIRAFLTQPKKQPAFRRPQAATDAHLFTVGVANPTSVLHKEHELAQVGADLLFLSETSAVSRTQRIMKPKLRQAGMSVVWGQPVQCHDSDAGPGQSRQGLPYFPRVKRMSLCLRCLSLCWPRNVWLRPW